MDPEKLTTVDAAEKGLRFKEPHPERKVEPLTARKFETDAVLRRLPDS